MLSGEKWERLNDTNRRVYDPDYISPTLTTNGGGHREAKIAVSDPRIAAIRGRETGESTQQCLEVGGDISNTLTTVQKDNVVLEPNIRVRKLTPREYWRLMGFDDESFDKASAINSSTQLYKQAGNSIVVNVLMAIFEKLLKGESQ